MKTIITLLSFLMLFGKYSQAQSFNCYIANDHLVSPTVYEFDEYIQSTSTDFNLRTIQGCFTFNPELIPEGAGITASYVSGSSELNNFMPAKIRWSNTAPGFEVVVTTNTNCNNGTVITSTKPVRVCTFRLTITNAKSFNCTPGNPNMVKPGDPVPAGLVLRMAVTKWNSLICSSSILSVPITGKGTYSQYASNTLYSNVNNTSAPVLELGNDKVISSGSVLTLDAGPGYSSYLWSTGAKTQKINVQNSGVFSVTVTSPGGCTQNDFMEVTVTSGLNAIDSENDINIFPNPAVNNLYIKPGKMTVKEINIYNALGQKQTALYSLTLIKDFGYIDVKLSSLTPGVYIVEMVTDDQKLTKRFVKE